MADEKVVVVSGNKLNSILTAFVAVLAVGLIIVAYFTWKKLTEDNLQLKNEIVEFKQLTANLVRASTNWATKDDVNGLLKNLVSKDDFKAIQDDLSKLGARLSAVGQTIGTINSRVGKLEKSTSEGPATQVATCSDGKIVDVYGYTQKTQNKELMDAKEAPVANVQFDASKDKPWSYEIYKKEFKIVNVVGKKEDGQLTFHNQLQYSIPDKDKNKIYDVDLVSSQYLQVPLKNQMFWFNPILDLNVFAGGNVYPFASWSGKPDNRFSLGFDLGLSFSSYGETRADSIFRFLRVGVGYDAWRQAGHFSFAPLAFNAGKFLPLMTNMYLTPQVAFDTAGGLTVGLGIGPHF